MLYRIYRIFLNLFHCPVFQKTRHFGNWICFHPQVKVGEKISTQLGPVQSTGPVIEITSLYGAQLSSCLLPHLHLRTETDPVSEKSCFLEYRTMEKVQKYSVNSVHYSITSHILYIYHIMT
jgi:hypothetical protein